MKRPLALVPLLVLACTSTPAPSTDIPAPGTSAAPPSTSAEQAWPVKTRYVLDLWLHGYAMLENDTTRVPYFRRGYRDRVVVDKNKGNVLTQLDANADRLRDHLNATPTLVSGQFLALYERNWEEMRSDIQTFLQADGDPRASRDQATQVMIATFAQTFATPADRDWLRLFANSLDDESSRFYQSWWNARERDRAATLAAVDSLWTKVYYPRFRGFLDNTQLARGEVLLAIPLDGEGRTITGGKQANSIAVSFPAAPDSAIEAVYVIAHEAMGTVAGQAVADNTTPTEKRAGAANRYQSPAAVRGGAILIRRVAPELLAGYEQYYLRAAGIASSGADSAAFARTFALPETMLSAMQRQLEVVLGGI